LALVLVGFAPNRSSCIGYFLVAWLAQDTELVGFTEQALNEAREVVETSQTPTRVYVV
jgi:hypothetical protein